MKSVRISSSVPFIPDEVVLQILCKATLKTLHRLKWVSRSWFSLIINEVLTKLVKSPNLILYYTHYSYRSKKLESNIDKALDFLPNCNGSRCPYLVVFDWCAGLVICRLCYKNRDGFCEGAQYYVCNPVEKSYNRIIPDFDPRVLLLDFNPSTSPHYRLVAVQPHSSRALEFHVYRSDKRFFEKVHVPCQCLHSVIARKNYIALWNGNVYLHCQIFPESEHSVRPEYRFLMITGVLGGSEHDIAFKFINFPKGSKVYTGIIWKYMGTWRDRLRFASVDDDGEIRVWALWGSQEDEWTLEHVCPCFHSSFELRPDDRLAYLVGLHPLQNALLFMFKNLLFAYDLDHMLFEKNCEIEDGEMYRARLVIPFSPCFAKEYWDDYYNWFCSKGLKTCWGKKKLM